MGQALIHRLADIQPETDILTLDVKPLDPELARRCAICLTGDIRDRHLLERLRSEFEIHAIIHLAAMLSTRAEFVPEAAHDINVEGTLGLLRLAVDEGRWQGGG
jgi:threonine 3-dehydrogenase